MTEDNFQIRSAKHPDGETIEGHAWLALFIAVGLVASGTWWYYGEHASFASGENDAAAISAIQKRDVQTKDLATQGISDDVSAIERDLGRSNLEDIDRELGIIGNLLPKE